MNININLFYGDESIHNLAFIRASFIKFNIERLDISYKQKEQLKKDAQTREDARLKQQQEWKNKVEAQKKANEEASKARQKKLQEKKDLFNKLISE